MLSQVSSITGWMVSIPSRHPVSRPAPKSGERTELRSVGFRPIGTTRFHAKRDVKSVKLEKQPDACKRCNDTKPPFGAGTVKDSFDVIMA